MIEKTSMTWVRDTKVLKFTIEILTGSYQEASVKVRPGERYGFLNLKVAKEELYEVYPGDPIDPGKLYTKDEVIEEFGITPGEKKEEYHLILDYPAAHVVKKFTDKDKLYDYLKKVCPDVNIFTPVDIL